MLHPNQFEINEAWVAFRLSDSPIRTDRDGDFECFALMDAASCYMLALELVPTDDSEPIEEEVSRLLDRGRSHKQQFPKALLVPHGLRIADALACAVERHSIPLVTVPGNELLIFIGEAQADFRDRFGT